MKDPRRLKSDPDRCYRVALLRSDEAEMLTRQAVNEYGDCCKHLDVMHSRGRRADGSEWRSCQVYGCGCIEETPPCPLIAMYVEDDKRAAKTARDNIITVCLIVGGAIGYLIGWLT